MAKTWGAVFLDPFVVTLLNSDGDQVLSRQFTDSRTFYVWDDIHVRARHVRIDSLEHGDGEWNFFFLNFGLVEFFIVLFTCCQ